MLTRPMSLSSTVVSLAILLMKMNARQSRHSSARTSGLLYMGQNFLVNCCMQKNITYYFDKIG